MGFKDTTLFVNHKNIKSKYKIFLIPKTIQMSRVTVHAHEKSKGNVAPSSISMIGNKLNKNIISDLVATET